MLINFPGISFVKLSFKMIHFDSFIATYYSLYKLKYNY